MRKLILNIKQSADSMGEKVFVFVEDINGATRISGISCTRLGDIRCGGSATYLVEDGNVRLFVIPENQSSNYDYTPLRLPVGDDDINLLGEFKSYTDGTKSFEVNFEKSKPAVKKEAPKKLSVAKKIESEKPAKEEKKAKPLAVILAVVAAMIIGTLLGYTVTTSIINAKKAKPKDFSAGAFNITLNGHFNQEYLPGYATTFASKDVGIFVLYEQFGEEDYLMTYTEKDYLKAIITRFGLKNIGVSTDVDLNFFEYPSVSEKNGKKYVNYVYAYKTPNGFWMVHFVVVESRVNRYIDKVSDWAHSVNFE